MVDPGKVWFLIKSVFFYKVSNDDFQALYIADSRSHKGILLARSSIPWNLPWSPCSRQDKHWHTLHNLTVTHWDPRSQTFGQGTMYFFSAQHPALLTITQDTINLLDPFQHLSNSIIYLWIKTPFTAASIVKNHNLPTNHCSWPLLSPSSIDKCLCHVFLLYVLGLNKAAQLKNRKIIVIF